MQSKLGSTNQYNQSHNPFCFIMPFYVENLMLEKPRDCSQLKNFNYKKIKGS